MQTRPDTSSANERKSRGGTTLVSALVASAITVSAGGVIGRQLQGDDPAPAADGPVAVAVPAAEDATAPAALPAAYDVQQLEYPGTGPALAPAAGYGEPVTDAGPLVANPGGAPDLRPDPEAGVTATPPPLEGAPEDPERPDAQHLGAVTEQIATAAELDALVTDPPAPADGPVDLPGVATQPAFADPCVTNPSAEGCGDGLQSTVLGQRRRPGVQAIWWGWVAENSVYSAECRRQISGLDYQASQVFAIVINVPMPEATMTLQFFEAVLGRYTMVPPGTPIGSRHEVTVRASAAISAAWATAFDRNLRTPAIPLCMALPNDVVAANRGGCTVDPLYWSYPRTCESNFEISVRGIDEQGFEWGAGLYRGNFNHTPEREDGGYAASQSAPVQIVPLDPFTMEVRVPLSSVAVNEQNPPNSGPSGSIGATQLVSAVGYPAGTDCRQVDPASGLVLSPLPVTRQFAQTRYRSVDRYAYNREAIISLGVPTRLGQGEGIDVCVFWYTFADAASWDTATVLKIERHTVVPPSRGATVIRFAGAGQGGDLFSLPHAQPGDSIRADRVIVSFLENPLLNRGCGFSGTNPIIVLRPRNDPGFLCRVESSGYLEFPSAELTYVELREPLIPEEVIDPGEADGNGRTTIDRAHAQRRVLIDNRGCTIDGCGPTRIERFNLRDGTWVDLTYTREPLVAGPALPNGRIITNGDPDRWVINPVGPFEQVPILRSAPATPNPRLDTISARLERNPANPKTSLDLVWRADRPVLAELFVQPRHSVSLTACPSVPQRVPAAGSTAYTDGGRATFTGLCPGTTYTAVIRLFAPQADGTFTESYFEYNTAEGLYLIATTEPRPAPADFDYRFELRLLPSGGPVSGAVTQGVAFMGPATLLGLPPTARDCTTLTAGQPFASGVGGADPIAGQEATVQLDITITRWAGAGGPACPPPGSLWAGTAIRIQATRVIRWDGTTTQTFVFVSGSYEVELTLTPVS